MFSISRKAAVCFLFLLIFSSFGFAQSYNLKVRLVDSKTREGVPFAVVSNAGCPVPEKAVLMLVVVDGMLMLSSASQPSKAFWPIVSKPSDRVTLLHISPWGRRA